MSEPIGDDGSSEKEELVNAKKAYEYFKTTNGTDMSQPIPWEVSKDINDWLMPSC